MGTLINLCSNIPNGENEPDYYYKSSSKDFVMEGFEHSWRLKLKLREHIPGYKFGNVLGLNYNVPSDIDDEPIFNKQNLVILETTGEHVRKYKKEIAQAETITNLETKLNTLGNSYNDIQKQLQLICTELNSSKKARRDFVIDILAKKISISGTGTIDFCEGVPPRTSHNHRQHFRISFGHEGFSLG